MNIDTQELVAAVDKSLEEKATELQEGFTAQLREFEQHHLTAMKGGGAPRTPGAMITGSERFGLLRQGHKSTGRMSLDGLNVKTLTSLQGSTDSPAEGVDVLPSQAAGLWGVGRRSLRLLDIIPRVPTASNSVRYTRLANFSNSAAAQAGEGATKATQTLEPVTVDAPIQTIAVIQKISKQLMDDEPFMRSALDSLFRYNLLDALEAQLIDGNGSGFNLSGMVTEGQAISGSSGVDQPDQVGAAIATMQSDGYPVDYIVVNPSDFQDWRAERSASDNLYVSGSWSQPAPPVMWNVNAVLSPSVSSGTVVLANNASHAMLDRQDATIEIFEQDDTNVQSNLLTLRAELRAGLAVMDPAGVRTLTLV